MTSKTLRRKLAKKKQRRAFGRCGECGGRVRKEIRDKILKTVADVKTWEKTYTIGSDEYNLVIECRACGVIKVYPWTGKLS